MEKRLYRSRRNKVIGGVCGGFGEFFDIDPVIIRLIWFALVFLGGTGILLYFIAWIIIPEKSREKEGVESQSRVRAERIAEGVSENSPNDTEKDYTVKINFESTTGEDKRSDESAKKGKIVIAAAFIIIGILILLSKLFNIWDIFSWKYILGILMLCLGGFTIYGAFKGDRK